MSRAFRGDGKDGRLSSPSSVSRMASSPSVVSRNSARRTSSALSASEDYRTSTDGCEDATDDNGSPSFNADEGDATGMDINDLPPPIATLPAVQEEPEKIDGKIVLGAFDKKSNMPLVIYACVDELIPILFRSISHSDFVVEFISTYTYFMTPSEFLTRIMDFVIQVFKDPDGVWQTPSGWSCCSPCHIILSLYHILHSSTVYFTLSTIHFTLSTLYSLYLTLHSLYLILHSLYLILHSRYHLCP